MNKMNLYANALYLRLYRIGETDNFTSSNPDARDYRSLNNSDKAIAEFMTEREEEMDDLPHYWNEDGYIDFESAYEALIGIADTNCDPEELDYVIPGNDDAIRAVKLIVSKMADAVIEANQGTQVEDVAQDVEEAEEVEE